MPDTIAWHSMLGFWPLILTINIGYSTVEPNLKFNLLPPSERRREGTVDRCT
jgi:hypothetical protein